MLKLLEDNEQMEDEVSSLLNTVDLDAESDDEDFAEGDGVSGDGSAMLLPPEYLNPDASYLVFESIGDILPAEVYFFLTQIPNKVKNPVMMILVTC